MGEHITDGSVYWLSENVDAGPIVSQDWCFIRPEDDAQSLWRRALQPMGLRLFETVLGDIGNGRLVRIPQDEALATWECPPVLRPDLLMLGGAIPGYTVVAEREQAGTTYFTKREATR